MPEPGAPNTNTTLGINCSLDAVTSVGAAMAVTCTVQQEEFNEEQYVGKTKLRELGWLKYDALKFTKMRYSFSSPMHN